MLAPIFLAAVATLVTGSTPAQLTTRGGLSMRVDGAVEVRGSNVVFRHVNGTLYSIPLAELDLDAESTAPVRPSGKRDDLIASARILKSTEEKQRLLAELSRNRSGKMPQLPAAATPASTSPTASGSSVTVGREADEWYWRNESRRLEEGARRAREEIALALREQQELEFKILSLLSLGYSPNQFSYDVRRLENSRNSMDRLRLEVERADRAVNQFRDDARRQDILPGWLR